VSEPVLSLDEPHKGATERVLGKRAYTSSCTSPEEKNQLVLLKAIELSKFSEYLNSTAYTVED
jgi:hypothetical protein